jgi:hypothetical protein
MNLIVKFILPYSVLPLWEKENTQAVSYNLTRIRQILVENFNENSANLCIWVNLYKYIEMTGVVWQKLNIPSYLTKQGHQSPSENIG